MQRDIAEFKTKLLRAYKDHLTLINNLPTDEIMRPDTREMVDSVQMLDRRAAAPSYDRPGQAPSMSGARKPQGIPQYEESFGEEASAPAEAPAEMPAEPAAAGFEPVTEAPAAEPSVGDTLPRVETPARRRPLGAPRGGAAMPMGEKPFQRKGGFTVDIDDSSSASLNARSPMPAPAPSRREPAFGEEPAAAAPMGDPGAGGDDGELSTPASLFKRRR